MHLPKYLSLPHKYLLYAHIYHNIRRITVGSTSQKDGAVWPSLLHYPMSTERYCSTATYPM